MPRSAIRHRAPAPAGGQHRPQLGGPGEWLTEKHGTKTRRSWRKLHLGVDAGTGRIEAVELTGNETDDGSRVGPVARSGRGGSGRLVHG